MHWVETSDMLFSADGYTNKYRGSFWLIQCALHPSINLPEHTRKYLKTLAQPQPMFSRGDHQGNSPPPELFGPTGSIKLVLDWCPDFGDEEAIICLLNTILTYAINVGDIWGQVRDELQEGDMPTYNWYVSGVSKTLYSYIQMIPDHFSNIPFQVRDQLKKIDYVDIWDRLWQEARNIHASGVPPAGRFVYRMIQWVLGSAMMHDSDPSGGIQYLILTHYECSWIDVEQEDNLLLSPRPDVDMSRVFTWADIRRRTEPIYIYRGWGRHFYGHIVPERPPGLSVPLSEPSTEGTDMDDPAEPVEHPFEPITIIGPGLEIPIEGITVYIRSPPTDARCSVCLDEFWVPANPSDGSSVTTTERATGRRCCKLNRCVHLFHRDCIRQWGR